MDLIVHKIKNMQIQNKFGTLSIINNSNVEKNKPIRMA